MHKHFPMFIDIHDKQIVVIGAGEIAARRVETLLEFTKHIHVIAPKQHEQIKSFAKQQQISVYSKCYQKKDLNGAFFVLAATDDHNLNLQIYKDSRALGIPANVCSDKDYCDFYFPAVVHRDNIVIAINSGGNDPSGVKAVSENIRELIKKGDL